MHASSIHQSPAMYMTAGLIAAGMGLGSVFAYQGGLWFGVALTVTAVLLILAVLGFAGVRVSVSDEGVVGRSALLGFRLIRADAEQIAGVGLRDVRPMAWGGWGLRLKPLGTALILRAGPAAVIERHDAKPLVIATDGAEDVAASVQELVPGLPR